MEQKRVTLANGIELDVADEGPRNAPVLIFLHGFPENHRTWRHQIAHFKDRFRCIAPDQRGYRGSSKPHGVTEYAPNKMISDVFQLADTLGIETFTIIGHDWGGAIAWGVALGGQHSRVTRAVIANAPHPIIYQRLLFTNRVQREAAQYIRTYRDPAKDPLIEARGLMGVWDDVAPFNLADTMEPQERAMLVEEWANPEGAMAMLNYYRASPLSVPDMDQPFTLPPDYKDPQIPKLTIPTLVIWALDDHALPPENIEGLGEFVSPMTLHKVPDCGHFVTWEAPDAVNAAMDSFLQS